MTPQLFSIEHAPAALPYWHTMWEDLGRPPVARIAKVLDVSRRTVYRYHKAGHAPRVVLLSLFWLTRWGRSAVHTQATNDALMAVTLVRGLEHRIKELTAQVGHLQRLGGYGSANAPLVHADPLPDGRLFMPEGHVQLPGSTLHPPVSAPPGPNPVDSPPATWAGERRAGAGDGGPAPAPAGRGPTGEAGREPEGLPA
jgi:predicted DNA-binding transcriptional regulator AlpA